MAWHILTYQKQTHKLIYNKYLSAQMRTISVSYEGSSRSNVGEPSVISSTIRRYAVSTYTWTYLTCSIYTLWRKIRAIPGLKYISRPLRKIFQKFQLSSDGIDDNY